MADLMNTLRALAEGWREDAEHLMQHEHLADIGSARLHDAKELERLLDLFEPKSSPMIVPKGWVVLEG